MKTQDGRLIVVAGASRSGKTAYVAERVKAERRIVAWDPEAQWCELRGWRKVTTRAQLIAAMQTPGAMKIAYVVGGDLAKEFDFLCDLVMFAGRYVAPLVAVLEELADVSTPSKAPGYYGILLRRGLKRGITIYCLSQRWSEADKTAFGNASEYVMFRQSSADDVRYLSRKTRVPVESIDALPSYHFIHYDPAERAITPGKLAFAK